MSAYVANAEGGSNGSVVGVGDTGSGTPFTVGSIGASATFTYSSTGGCKRGGLCYAYSTSGTAALTYRGWNTNAGASAGAAPFRVYIDPADFTGTTTIILRGMDTTGATQRWRLILTSSTVSLRDSSNSGVSGCTSGALSSGTRYRVEGYVAGANSGACRLIVYVGDSLTATFDSGATTGSFGGLVQHVRVGIGSSTASQSGKVDDVAIGEPGDALFGPSVVPGAGGLTSPATLTGAARVRVRTAAGQTGSATLAGTCRVRVRGGVALTSSGTLAGTGRLTIYGHSGPSGTASLAGSGRLRVRAAGALAASGTLAGAGRPRIRCGAALDGASTLTGAPQTSQTVPGAADWAASGALAGVAAGVVYAGASWLGEGTATLISHVTGLTLRRTTTPASRTAGDSTARRVAEPTVRG